MLKYAQILRYPSHRRTLAMPLQQLPEIAYELDSMEDHAHLTMDEAVRCMEVFNVPVEIDSIEVHHQIVSSAEFGMIIGRCDLLHLERSVDEMNIEVAARGVQIGTSVAGGVDQDHHLIDLDDTGAGAQDRGIQMMKQTYQ